MKELIEKFIASIYIHQKKYGLNNKRNDQFFFLYLAIIGVVFFLSHSLIITTLAVLIEITGERDILLQFTKYGFALVILFTIVLTLIIYQRLMKNRLPQIIFVHRNKLGKNRSLIAYIILLSSGILFFLTFYISYHIIW